MFALHASRCSSWMKPPYPNCCAQCGSCGGRMCVWTSRHFISRPRRLLVLAPARPAGRMRRIAPIPRKHGRELRDNVRQVERLAVELGPAALAHPEERVLLAVEPAPLDDEPHRIG